MRAQKKSDIKMAIREEARRKVRPSTSNIGADRAYRADVEAGRRQLGVVSAQSGDSEGKKAKNELLYLINNYLPAYDMRIEQLIDQWRRSGDPDYERSRHPGQIPPGAPGLHQQEPRGVSAHPSRRANVADVFPGNPTSRPQRTRIVCASTARRRLGSSTKETQGPRQQLRALSGHDAAPTLRIITFCGLS